MQKKNREEAEACIKILRAKLYCACRRIGASKPVAPRNLMKNLQETDNEVRKSKAKFIYDIILNVYDTLYHVSPSITLSMGAARVPRNSNHHDRECKTVRMHRASTLRWPRNYCTVVAFRLLAIFFPERFLSMKFRRVPMNALRWFKPDPYIDHVEKIVGPKIGAQRWWHLWRSLASSSGYLPGHSPWQRHLIELQHRWHCLGLHRISG